MKARLLFTPLAAVMAALVLYLAAVTTVRADDPPPVVAPVDRTVDGLDVDEWKGQAVRWHHAAARYRRQALRRWRPTVDYAYRLASAVFGVPYWQLHAVGGCESHHYPFADHAVYVEVFGGGASVLFTKPPSQLEVYNDADSSLVTFFRLLRDRPAELIPLLELTPYSREEFELCRDTWVDVDDELERARRWFVLVAQSFGAFAMRDDGSTLGRGWGGERLGRLHLARAASTANRIDHIWRFVQRIRLVQIEHLDWRECIDRYDGPEACLYIDPPYLPETRRSGSYAHELTAEDHEELVDRLLTLQGEALVSGYDSDLYRRLEAAGWHRHEFDAVCTAAKREVNSVRNLRTEVVWTTSDPPARLFAGHA